MFLRILRKNEETLSIYRYLGLQRGLSEAVDRRCVFFIKIKKGALTVNLAFDPFAANLATT